LRGQPYFNIVAACGTKPKVASAKLHHTVGQLKQLEDFFGMTHQSLQGGLALFGGGNVDEFDLLKLVLTYQATGISASTACLSPKARRKGRKSHGELVGF
jgi:hypothetical protein